MALVSGGSGEDGGGLCGEGLSMVGVVVVVGGDGCLSAGVCGVLGVAVVVGWAEVQNNDR